MGGGMMNMMGGRMPMMDMMQSMGMMRQGGDGMGGMETVDRVEGRIAFLRTELKITDAQASVWNGFAEALQTNAKTLGEVRKSMMSQAGAPSLVDRLTQQEKWLAARLDGTRAIKAALAALVGVLSDEQKKSADELLAPHLGMMPMMAGMQSGQTMGVGRMPEAKPAR
ncbi:Spy/CpxP family protein refolding chaperone [Bradyrhizobium sp. USDA 10063]